MLNIQEFLKKEEYFGKSDVPLNTFILGNRLKIQWIVSTSLLEIFQKVLCPKILGNHQKTHP